MECGICARDLEGKRKPLCPGCAQAALYGQRIQQASSLLAREKQHIYAEAVLRPGNDGVIAALPEDADWDAITTSVKNHGSVKAREERRVLETRINDITEKAAGLRQQINDYKQYAAKQKHVHSQRKQALANERKELEKRRPRNLDPLRHTIHKAGQKLEKIHCRTADSRALLCEESARLSGLKKKKGKDGRSQYWIGNVPIPDLRELNGKVEYGTTSTGEPVAQAHEVISAAMDNICRLLGNCCQHLSVRLPAEILLPTNDFPHAGILPEKASYKTKRTQYHELLSSRLYSPAASRLLDASKSQISRPRVLQITRPLQELFKEDTKGFQLFVEGVMLLAWDVAWLCRSQGIDTINTFDDVCAVGRNLYQLFLTSEQQRPSGIPNQSPTPAKSAPGRSTVPAPAFRLGAYSHGSASHSLVSYQGRARMEKWRLASSARIVIKLKSYLQNGISGAEWDFISGGEWDEEEDHDRPVFVGGVRRMLPDNAGGPAMSVMTVKPSDDVDEGGQTSDGKRKNNSGWMKVRGRGNDS